MAQPQQQQRYRVIEKIASGGMAEVFRAESAGLEGFKKTVAIKRVLPHLSEKKQFIGMFLDEARVGAQLGHSNCVQVFDIGVGDDTYFIVMEYVDGADLKAIIESHRQSGRTVPVEVACLICVRICEGLAYAHELADSKGRPMNIVHRDMSPPNVLITRYGEVKIVDFGLAKANSQLERSEPGIIKGKFSYLSPEAAYGKSIDARTDIFAVGIILWELLSARRLFLGETDLETVRQVQRAQVPKLSSINRDVSDELDRVLAKALAADPAQRYQTARDFGHDLNQVLFRCKHPVSSFDIAQLVAPVRSEREVEKKKVARRSIIGSLIDEALFEFTSIEEQERAAGESVVGSPTDAPAVGQDWASRLGDLGLAGGDAPSTRQFEAGNLSALEDDSPFSRSPGAIKASGSRGATTVPPQRPEPMAVVVEPMAPPTRPNSSASSGSTGTIVVVVLLVLIAGVAGAWFGGLLPEDILPPNLRP
jgi:serine/threonine-protein kinase